MLKTLIAASTILIAVSGMAQASVPMADVTSLTSTTNQGLGLDALSPKLYADNENDGKDDNGGADDNDDTGCTAAKSHDKYTICHG